MEQIIRLWQTTAPGARGQDPDRDIPFLTPYWPMASGETGASVIVCPGGGYGGRADYEGRDYALWLNERGIAAFVLNYRLGSHGYRFPVITNDLVRAMRVVRANSAGWGLDGARIGVMGSSAGGHLASTLLVHFDSGASEAADPVERVSSRPDFGILCYPVISMVPPWGHEGSKRNLLGPEPSIEEADYLSTEKHVRKDTPPCFIWHTQDDEMVRVENALVFASALMACGVPTSLHIYPSGPHGLALGFKGCQTNDARPLHAWTRELDEWLRLNGYEGASDGNG
jgi:acetyl esterase/lipase